MRISDWSSDVCSSDLVDDNLDGGTQARQRADIECQIADEQAGDAIEGGGLHRTAGQDAEQQPGESQNNRPDPLWRQHAAPGRHLVFRSEEHTSEPPSLMRISYAVFCLNKTTTYHNTQNDHHT